MTVPTTRIGLLKPTTADDFVTDDLADNLDLIDGQPGAFICTSGTRPGSWGAPHEGMLIYETDSNLYWRWDGAAFVRAWPVGLLNTTSVSADVQVLDSNLVDIVACPVVVPEGGRDIEINVMWYKFESTEGWGIMVLQRDATLVQRWHPVGLTGGTGADSPRGGSMSIIDEAPAAGAHTYNFRFAMITSGTAIVRWDNAQGLPGARISVKEV